MLAMAADAVCKASTSDTLSPINCALSCCRPAKTALEFVLLPVMKEPSAPINVPTTAYQSGATARLSHSARVRVMPAFCITVAMATIARIPMAGRMPF